MQKSIQQWVRRLGTQPVLDLLSQTQHEPLGRRAKANVRDRVAASRADVEDAIKSALAKQTVFSLIKEVEQFGKAQAQLSAFIRLAWQANQVPAAGACPIKMSCSPLDHAALAARLEAGNASTSQRLEPQHREPPAGPAPELIPKMRQAFFAGTGDAEVRTFLGSANPEATDATEAFKAWVEYVEEGPQAEIRDRKAQYSEQLAELAHLHLLGLGVPHSVEYSLNGPLIRLLGKTTRLGAIADRLRGSAAAGQPEDKPMEIIYLPALAISPGIAGAYNGPHHTVLIHGLSLIAPEQLDGVSMHELGHAGRYVRDTFGAYSGFFSGPATGKPLGLGAGFYSTFQATDEMVEYHKTFELMLRGRRGQILSGGEKTAFDQCLLLGLDVSLRSLALTESAAQRKKEASPQLQGRRPCVVIPTQAGQPSLYFPLPPGDAHDDLAGRIDGLLRRARGHVDFFRVALAWGDAFAQSPDDTQKLILIQAMLEAAPTILRQIRSGEPPPETQMRAQLEGYLSRLLKVRPEVAALIKD